MANMMSPEDYIFGSAWRTSHLGAEQGGIYLRAFRGFRIENLAESAVEALHEYFIELGKRESENLAKYSMILGNTLPFGNRFSRVERGNCSYWTSKGLVAAGIMSEASMWPKILFIKLYFEMVKAQRTNMLDSPFHPTNVNIVAYRKVATRGHDHLANSWISPSWFWSYQGSIFRPLERFGNCVVQTPACPPNLHTPWKSTATFVPHPFRPFFLD